MNKSTMFKLAHKKANKEALKAAVLGRKFNYQVTFSYYLKEAINSQPQKVTVYDGTKKVNKACAMVGDYKKPAVTIKGLKIIHKKSPTLKVTYNTEFLLLLIVLFLNPFSLLMYCGLYANFIAGKIL